MFIANKTSPLFILIFSALLILDHTTLFSQPLKNRLNGDDEREQLRGVWIATAYGIDWPKTYDPEKQKESLQEIFHDIKKKNLNAVFFQVRIRGDVLFYSPYEPFSNVLTGSLGVIPDYDPVAYAISLAKENGLEFHAWFNTMILNGKNSTPQSEGVAHIWQAHPEWIDKRARKNAWQKTAYLNPALPEVRAHLIRLITDFAERYDIDGIQLDDYLRYPTKDFPDDEEFEKYNPKKLSLDDWRRENINQFVGDLYDSLMQRKPYLKFGVTPIGVYTRVDDVPAMESYHDVYQDSREWVRRKKCDYLAPQIYFHTGKTTAADRRKNKTNPPFENLVRDWGGNMPFRHLYVGIGMYKPPIKEEWPHQVELAEKAGAEGVIFYPYHAIEDIPLLFKTQARVPQMKWKSLLDPAPPAKLSCEKSGDKAIIRWDVSDDIRWVNLYKLNFSIKRPFLHRLWGKEVQLQLQPGEVIFMTAVDRYGNESKPSMPILAP
ncbi:protein of unknown function DUF187 [Chloroherpeton thalassium ATCC 35110]|uniref:Glycosyl hydrolase-like 10 domain-containing protein n=1 Tax=Chloroherpeton thalassium (strain ATCC 35110 / GB-78) TaxID=517418 RepID=B3QYB7_CHLT3|nr:family 10 glycosylhydrolase [Chloroherpeton thalassium]ACF15083.1 protein of unknown function DUF187 [Chloroherpeton thalassium ATCC 35110]